MAFMGIRTVEAQVRFELPSGAKALKPRPALQMTSQSIPRQLHELLVSENCILFVGRSPAGELGPKSQSAIDLCNYYQIYPKIIDISQDDELERAVQSHSGWQYFPQLYVFGEFVGGAFFAADLF